MDKKCIVMDDLVAEVADKYKISRKVARGIVDTIFEAIIRNLVKGVDVKLTKFFNFFTKTRKAYTTKNRFDGTEIEVPPTRTIYAKMTKQVKDRVQGKS